MANGHAGDATMEALMEPVGAIMERRFARLPEAISCADAVASLAGQAEAATIYQAAVIGEGGGFLGFVSLRDCLAAPGETPLARIMTRPSAHLRETMEAEVAAHRLLHDGAEAWPVVAQDGTIEGIVTAERARAYLLANFEEDADRFVGIVGTVKDDYLDHTVWSDFRRRIPWVLGLAVAGLAAGYVVHIYEDALSALVILALYMPMVADTGGNVGTQSASLITRAMSVGDVSVRDAGRVLWREARVSLLMAASLFTFAFLKVYLISNAADVPGGLSIEMIGAAIGLALAMQVISATLIGALLPLGAVAARQDPAVISGPALTTIVDLSGLILYFSITTWLLGLTGAV
ncbi:magnesium transporter [Acuticoccus sp. M5D2P5]|uniref:magnesium transporter n=1 Tax=Acuticoccus kalidii TaxID=2910977 RepID=UPI001F463344|nr:magnesium transporter [Acuticoccus kalidii]MCF3935687.1 magnesium transporter [Acuticoccus kalidii]